MAYHKVLKTSHVTQDTWSTYPAIVLPLTAKSMKSNDYSKAMPSGYGAKIHKYLHTAAKVSKFKPKAGKLFSADIAAGQSMTIAVLPEDASSFNVLTQARKSLARAVAQKAQKILVDLRGLPEANADVVADAYVAAVGAKRYHAPKYGKCADDPAYQPKVDFLANAEWVAPVKFAADRAGHETEGTNLVRYLAELPPNDLTCKGYVQRCRDIAKANGLTFEFINQAKLQKMGAGAFLAVAQGSAHTDAGIVALTYKPKAPTNDIAFVGKGLVYDTGGSNLKTGNYMFGMHGDMTGSAVALAMVVLAANQEWPEKVTAYLAINDNSIGSRAYRPNDVVMSLSGQSIEVINTDAEGRMCLADTLTYVSRKNPALIMDFATLTGSAIGAIGTTYSTGYSNNARLRDSINHCGRLAGERVWAFPLDDDFGDCLDSDFADTKQCRLRGGVDHIEAAMFLKKFVEGKTPWVHIDLASSDHDGGLAHVAGPTTGFGVRFASRFIEQWRRSEDS